MVAALHTAGIRLILDIVPNHTSSRHEWFREAIASPKDSAARERYVFLNGLGEDGHLPPTDWTSVFGGPAWAPVGDGQWCVHYFATEQPDLNWKNREVRDDFIRTLRFWTDCGFDGFFGVFSEDDGPVGRVPSMKARTSNLARGRALRLGVAR